MNKAMEALLAPSPTPPCPMGNAVRRACIEPAREPLIDRAHMEALRAAATRLDTSAAEETQLRGQHITALRMLTTAIGLLDNATATQINDLRNQYESFIRRNTTS